MNNIIYIILFIFIGCSKENDSSNKLVGKWQLIEYCLDNGGGTLECSNVENGLIYNFSNNENFTVTNTNSTCVDGDFTSDATSIFLDYNNEEDCSLSGSVYILDYTFIDENLRLTPSVENQNFDEECFGIYSKI